MLYNAIIMAAGTFETFKERLPEYIHEVEQANSEASKALSFLILIRQTFEGIVADTPLNLVPKLEFYVRVRAGTVMVRGRIDALLGNVVVEFKMVLDEVRLKEAKDQLKKYVAALWAIDGQRTNYVLMATDGLRFKVYSPAAPMTTREVSPDEVVLDEVNLMDIETTVSEDAFRWLDRYVLWQERIPPRTEDMVGDFGLDSPVYTSAMERLKTALGKSKEVAAAPFQEWSKYLSVVYGSTVGDEVLFLKHTYLATLAKLMVYTYYSSGAIPSREEVRKVLKGEAFKEWGIENFLEEDFFSWLVRGETEEEGVGLAWDLLKVLERYDLSRLTEDVIKGLYQGLVDPLDRHDLGEYYTPEWLAEWIEEHVLEDPMDTALDPACGSGTFLAVAVRRKVDNLQMEPHLLLTHILASVKGIDIHPLAVLTSKANYLMALGDLVKFKSGRIHIPVYLANSIDFPKAKRDIEHGVEVFRYPVSNKISLVLPIEAAEKGTVSELVEAIGRFARMMTHNIVKSDPQLFDGFMVKEVPGYAGLLEGSKDSLWDTCKTLADLITGNKDTIYVFIMKNVYRPATMGPFDALMGNPPWISYRYIRLPSYQKVLKRMILQEHKLLSPKKTELLTQMELATLFFARCTKLYLREGGRIGFVMPRAIFTGDQHDAFRRGDFDPKIGFKEVVDLEGVTPLFNMPTAVVIAEKGGEVGPPDSATRMRGNLPEKNASLDSVKELQVRGEFAIERAEMMLVELGKRTAWTYTGEAPCGGRPLKPGPSAYQDQFRNGAALYPRQLWWVDVVAHPRFGLNPKRPFVQTSTRAAKMAKESWKGLKISGLVESQYLYAGLLGADLLPFAFLPPRVLVVPAEPARQSYTILTRQQIESIGHREMAKWLTKVEGEWKKRRKGKAEKVDIYSYLDWGGKLSKQNPRSKHVVCYNTSGTFIAACPIKLKALKDVTVNGRTIPLRGCLIDITSVYSGCDSLGEASYLAAILNSRVLGSITKSMQAKGLWGARHIHQKPLEIGIPKFNSKNEIHGRLDALARGCTTIAERIRDEFVQQRSGKVDALSPQVIGQLRSKIRSALKEELDSIDELVCEVLTAN